MISQRRECVESQGSCGPRVRTSFWIQSLDSCQVDIFGDRSDAAGKVIRTGPKVTRSSNGQRVWPIFHLTHLYGAVQDGDIACQLGGTHDRVFREYGVFNEQGCIEIPSNLGYRKVAALPCAALNAWNALYGGPRNLKTGEVVLTQGTGGVSIFALQFAKTGGAQIISTVAWKRRLDYERTVQRLSSTMKMIANGTRQ